MFLPNTTEMGAETYRVKASHAASTLIVINELLASNKTGKKDPQGELEDWIELKNLSDTAIDVSGMYLSDSLDNPRKWRFPDGVEIPANGYLVVWADEDGKAGNGLHANFKLSKGGESLLLVDTDERQNAILDVMEYPKLRSDVAFGRLPDGTGEPQICRPTAGASNRP